MENEIMDYVSDDNVPAIADDSLLRVAEMAERRIEAVIKIKQMALKVTNPNDWNDQGGRPYLQVSGSEKVANLFNISWRLDEPTIDTEDDGNFTYIMRGIFSIPGRSISAEGSRSSKDPFFKKYEYGNGVRKEKPISAIDKRDVRMAALTNLLGNGITRLLGIRNLSYEDLDAFAGIKKEMISKIDYKKDKEPIKQPQTKTESNKAEDTTSGNTISESQRKRFYAIYKKSGKTDETVKAYLKTKYGIEHSKDIPRAVYEVICAWAEATEPETTVQEDDINCPKLKIKVGKTICETCTTSDDCEPYQMFLDSQR